MEIDRSTVENTCAMLVATAGVLLIAAALRRERGLVVTLFLIAIVCGTTGLVGGICGLPWRSPEERAVMTAVSEDGGTLGVQSASREFHPRIWHVHFEEQRPKFSTLKSLHRLPGLQSVGITRGLFTDQELVEVQKVLPDDVHLQVFEHVPQQE